MFGIMQLSCMIVVQDVSEYFRVTIKEVLASFLVEEELAFSWAEERVGVLLERVPPRLKAPPRHIDEHLLILGLTSVLQHGRRRQRARCYGNPTDGSGPRKWQPGWGNRVFHPSVMFAKVLSLPAATEAMCGGIFLSVVEIQDETQSATASLRVFLCQRSRSSFCRFQMNANRKM